MRKEQLDDSLKNKLGSYESNVPEHIWEGVAARLDESKEVAPAFWLRNRVKLFGTAAALFLGSLTLGVMQYTNEERRQNAQDQETHSYTLDNTVHEDTEIVSVDQNISNLSESIQSYLTSDVNTPLNNDNALIDSNLSEELLTVTKNESEGSANVELEQVDITFQEHSSVNERKSITSIPSIIHPLKHEVTLFNKDQQCADFRETRNNLYWSLSYSQDFPIRNIVPVNDNLQEYVYLREESEVFNNAFSVNMNLGLALRNGLNFRTGLFYSRLSEQFSHDILTGTEIVTKQVIDEEGNVLGTTTDTSFIYNNVSNTNLYETVDLPVLVGFEKSNEKFGMGFYTGLMVNLVFNKAGSVISPVDNQSVIGLSDTGAAGTYFNKNMGISYYASTVVTYKLTNRLNLKLEPYFRYSPKSISNINYRVNQNYYVFGGQIGLRYNL